MGLSIHCGRVPTGSRESKVLLGSLSNFSETEGCAAGCANRGEETLDRLDEFEAATLAIKLRALGEKLLVRTGDLDVPPVGQLHRACQEASPAVVRH